LFKRYPTFKKLSEADISELEKIIRPINYYKTKAKNLLNTSIAITSDYKGKLPQTHEDLISLPGVGRKTANVILSEKGITPALPVDTHVFRVAKRLGLAKSDNRDKVEEELKAHFK